MSALRSIGENHAVRLARPEAGAASETSRPDVDSPPDDAPGYGAPASAGRSAAAADRELLSRVAGGDREAFRRLYLEYHPRLSRFLFRILRRHEDAEDVVNEVMLIVWQHAGTFRGASQVSSWIFGIGYRCALKCIRRAEVRTRAASLEAESRPLVTEDASRATENRQLLDLGLARLPPDQQLVLVLAYEMDCSCDEIAAIVGSPVNTVKTRMFHARRKLRAFASDLDAAADHGA